MVQTNSAPAHFTPDRYTMNTNGVSSVSSSSLIMQPSTEGQRRKQVFNARPPAFGFSRNIQNPNHTKKMSFLEADQFQPAQAGLAGQMKKPQQTPIARSFPFEYEGSGRRSESHYRWKGRLSGLDEEKPPTL
jgi:hypothetical protein